MGSSNQQKALWKKTKIPWKGKNSASKFKTATLDLTQFPVFWLVLHISGLLAYIITEPIPYNKFLSVSFPSCFSLFLFLYLTVSVYSSLSLSLFHNERWTPRSIGVQYATGEEQRNSLRKNEKAEPKQKQHPLVDVSGGENRAQCCKQYCIGTWNGRSMKWPNRRWQEWILTF